MKVGSFLVLGNDRKMKSCVERLEKSGFDAYLFNDNENFDVLNKYKNIILPLPTISNSKISGTLISIDEIIRNCKNEQRIFFGNIKEHLNNNFKSYYYNEAFLLRNSRLTAQGVLRLIIENTEKDITNLNIAVTGFGRCGKAICRLLKSCGMNVISFSRRNETQEEARDYGLKAYGISYMNEYLKNFDVIVNTVPFNIIDKKSITKLTDKNIYIEIASKPYGFNISTTDIFSFKYILGESLPGRFFPVSAGYNIADMVLNILKEEENG